METVERDKVEKLRASRTQAAKTETADRPNPTPANPPAPTNPPAGKGFSARLFRNARLTPGGHEDIVELSRRAAVVHVFEQRSRTDLACLKRKYQAEGLPAPEHVIGTPGSGRWWRRRREDDDSIPGQGKPQAMFMGDNADVERLAKLIKLSDEVSYPVILAPQILLYERRPAKSEAAGWWDSLVRPGGKPKMLRKWWALIRSGGKVIIAAADPIDIKRFCSRPDVKDLPDLAKARMLRDTLHTVFRAERRVVIGPHLPQRERMKEIVRRNPLLIESVAQEAARSERTEWEVWAEVDGYLHEIMADYNVTYIRIWDIVLSWVWERFFGGVVLDHVGLERTRRAVRKGPVIYVPCHKSHADYLLVSHMLFVNDMTPPHIAAGRNLNFWPLGHIFRKSGAFFMRRSFSNTGIYKVVFECYLRSLSREGFNIEFFIEGGRSRTGKLFLPKMGVLGMFIRAFEEGELPDLSFVPISISYDRIPEEGELLRDSQATEKKKSGLVGAILELTKRNFGRIHMNFAPPISLKEFLASCEAEPSAMDVRTRHALYRDFAFRAIRAINDVSVITPTSVTASALLARTSPGTEEEVVMADAATLLSYLEETGVRLAPTFRHPGNALAESMRLFRSTRDITEVTLPAGQTDEKMIAIEPEKRPNLEYYKNNALHDLYSPAFVACSLIANGNEGISQRQIELDYAQMMRFFKYEFVYDAHWPVESEVRRVLDIFQKWGILEFVPNSRTKHKTGWLITKHGRDTLYLFSGLVENFIEAYLFTVENLPRIYGPAEFVFDDAAKQLVKAGFKAFHLGNITRREAISVVTLRNALAMMAHLVLIEEIDTPENEKQIWHISPDSEQLLNDYAQKLRRLARKTTG